MRRPGSWRQAKPWPCSQVNWTIPYEWPPGLPPGRPHMRRSVVVEFSVARSTWSSSLAWAMSADGSDRATADDAVATDVLVRVRPVRQERVAPTWMRSRHRHGSRPLGCVEGRACCRNRGAAGAPHTGPPTLFEGCALTALEVQHLPMGVSSRNPRSSRSEAQR